MLKQYESTLRDSTNPSQSGSSHTPNVSYLVMSVRSLRIFTDRKPKKKERTNGTINQQTAYPYGKKSKLLRKAILG